MHGQEDLHDGIERRAYEVFEGLLSSEPEQTWAQHQALQVRLAEERLTVGNQPLPLNITPVVMARGRWNRLAQNLDRLQRILTRLEPLLIREDWLTWLGLPPEEQEWIRFEGQLSAGSTISRVDGFLVPEQVSESGYQIVELNVDSPGGAAFLDRCASLVENTPLWREFSRSVPGGTPRLTTHLYPHLENCWQRYRKEHPGLESEQEKPRIAIVDWITVSTHREFELLADGLQARGFPALVADPRELEFRGGRLRCFDGKPIDLVYRRVLVEDLLRDPAGSRALLDACRANRVCVVNSFASKPLTVKSLLALFHDHRAQELLDGSDLRFLRTLVPLTLRLTRETERRIQREQERFVLKPADGWGAQGLHLGWRCSRQEWNEHLKRCLALGGYIAQERVPIPKLDVPTWTGDRWQSFPYLFDLSPYGLGERTLLPHARLSPSEVLNVKQGARIAQVWVAEHPPD